VGEIHRILRPQVACDQLVIGHLTYFFGGYQRLFGFVARGGFASLQKDENPATTGAKNRTFFWR
jgi:hypothetical protein